jgi:VCBS repeat-containing protein
VPDDDGVTRVQRRPVPRRIAALAVTTVAAFAALGPVTSRAGAAAVPGIKIKPPTAPATAAADGLIATKTKLTNTGKKTAPAGRLRVYLTSSTKLRGEVVADVKVPKIAAKSFRVIKINGEIPAALPGRDYRVLLAYDTAATICTAKKPCSTAKTVLSKTLVEVTGAPVVKADPTAPGATTPAVGATTPALPVNSPPVATDSSAATIEDGSAFSPLNATDAEGSPLSYTLVTQPAHGQLSGNAPSYIYTPAPNFEGTDQFTFKASDGTDDSNVATVTLYVTSAPDAPVAVADAYAVDEDDVLTVGAPGVLANDTDVDSTTLIAQGVTEPKNGTLSLGGDGHFTYKPDVNFYGDDHFKYAADDSTQGSNEVEVTIHVKPLDDPPVALDDTYAIQQSVVLHTNVLVNDLHDDLDGDTLTAIKTTDPASGTAVLQSNGDLAFEFSPGFIGSFTSFKYRVYDGHSYSPEATVQIKLIHPPVAVADSYAATEDHVLTVAAGAGVLANDTDEDTGDTKTAAKVSGPAHGAVVVHADGSFVYTPELNFDGTATAGIDSFTYSVTDSYGASSTAIATIHLTPVNDAPVATNGAYSVSHDADLYAAAPGTDVDSPIDSLYWAMGVDAQLKGPDNGVLDWNPEGAFHYTPNPAFVGDDTFEYRMDDDFLVSSVATITIHVLATP